MPKINNILFVLLYSGVYLMPHFPGLALGESNPNELYDTPTQDSYNDTPEEPRTLSQDCQYVSPEFYNLLDKDPLEALIKGSLYQGGLSYHEALAYLNWLTNNYKETIETYQLGHTVGGLPIQGYRIGGRLKKDYLDHLNQSSNTEDKNQSFKKVEHWDKPEPFPEVLLTSLHHARENCSITTLLYTITKLLQNGLAGNTLSNYILSNREVWIIPIINGDGFLDICLKDNLNIRKNRRQTCKTSDESSEFQGVDLNRNYPFHYSYVDDQCNDEYGGQKPFSEPETQTIRNFVGSYKPRSALSYLTGPLKFILHLHTYGDFWTHPYNCCPSIELQRYASMTIDELKFSLNIEMGNAKTTLDYITYGEADDWAMNEHQIISISPEVSDPPDEWPLKEKFWPPTDIRLDSHIDNYPRFIEIMKKSGLQANFHAHIINEPNNYSIFPVKHTPVYLRDKIMKMMNSRKIFSVVQLHISNTGLSGSYGLNLPVFIQFTCSEEEHILDSQPKIYKKYVKLEEEPDKEAKSIFSKSRLGCKAQPNLAVYSDKGEFMNAKKVVAHKNSSPIWRFKLNNAIESRTPTMPSSPTTEIFLIVEFDEMTTGSSFDINICLGESQLKNVQYCQCGSIAGYFDLNPNLINPVPEWIHSPANIYSSKDEQLCIFDDTWFSDFKNSTSSGGLPFISKRELPHLNQSANLGVLILVAEIIIALMFAFCFYRIARRFHRRGNSLLYTKLNRDLSHESFEIGSIDGNEMIEISYQADVNQDAPRDNMHI